MVGDHDAVRARARLNATLSDGIVAARHGRWQACPELDPPGYDALDPDGANLNLAIGVEAADPVSGARLAPLLSVRDQKAGLTVPRPWRRQ